MRIIFDGVVYSFAPSGGVYNYFNHLIPLIAKMPGNEVRVWVPKHSASPPHDAEITIERNVLPTISPRLLPQGALRTNLSQLKRWMESQLLGFRMRGVGEAVYHTTGFTVSPWKDVARVLTVYDMISEVLDADLNLPHIVKMRAEKKHAIENTDRYIAISAVTKRDLCRVYSIPEEKVDVIHFGVDHDFFGRIRAESERKRVRKLFNLDGPYILYIGGRLHHKNFNRFLQAYAESTAKKDYLLAVAGFDWSPDEKALITKLGVGERLRYMKYDAVSGALPALYQMASAFVFPSLYEGFGLPLLEAFAAGCPVAAANAGPFPEIAGDAAAFFDPRDVTDITRVMESLLSPTVALEYKKRGFERVKQFQWEKAAAETMETYRRALEQTRKPVKKGARAA